MNRGPTHLGLRSYTDGLGFSICAPWLAHLHEACHEPVHLPVLPLTHNTTISYYLSYKFNNKNTISIYSILGMNMIWVNYILTCGITQNHVTVLLTSSSIMNPHIIYIKPQHPNLDSSIFSNKYDMMDNDQRS